MFKTRFICADDVITALQKRWKSLRDKFRRLLKGLQEEKKKRRRCRRRAGRRRLAVFRANDVPARHNGI